MATSNGNNSGIFKDRNKNVCTKQGVFTVKQFNRMVEIYIMVPRLPW